MSQISSTGSDPGLAQMLQQAQQRQSTPAKGQGRADFESKAKAAGIDVNALKGLHGEMRSAVQDALKNASPGAERQTTIQQAIDGVLQKHGIDPAQLKSQFQAAGLKPPGQYDGSGKTHRHGHHGQAQGASQGQGQVQSAQDNDADDDGSAAVASVFQQANTGTLVDTAA